MAWTTEKVEGLVYRHGLQRLGGPIRLGADVTPFAVADLGLVPGAAVWASVKATELAVYPA